MYAVQAGIVITIILLSGCRGPGRSEAGATSRSEAPAAAATTGGNAPGDTPARAQAALRDPVAMKVNAEVDGKEATYTGLGECTHTRDASIYEVPASMWSARVGAGSGELHYLNLTLWQPGGVGDLQVSLGLTLGDRTHDIATVKGASLKGSAKARVESKGDGGSLEVDGKSADGGAVHLR